MKAAPFLRRLAAFGELTKPRLSLLVLFVTACSFWIASSATPDGSALAWLAGGTGLLAAGIAALNQYQEREVDARMERTRRRPLPERRLSPGQALACGTGLSLVALALLAGRFGRLAGLLALLTLGSYLFVYVPLKSRTACHPLPGAVSGAMPALLGWAAATGRVDPGAWTLFAILFFWQIPHFLIIQRLYREDYRAAGIRTWAADDRRLEKTAWLLPASLALLAAAGLGPLLVMPVRPFYPAVAAALGGGLLVLGRGGPLRRLGVATMLYLPLLFGALAASLL